jgi:hypothetical protein
MARDPLRLPHARAAAGACVREPAGRRGPAGAVLCTRDGGAASGGGGQRRRLQGTDDGGGADGGGASRHVDTSQVRLLLSAPITMQPMGAGGDMEARKRRNVWESQSVDVVINPITPLRARPYRHIATPRLPRGGEESHAPRWPRGAVAGATRCRASARGC